MSKKDVILTCRHKMLYERKGLLSHRFCTFLLFKNYERMSLSVKVSDRHRLGSAIESRMLPRHSEYNHYMHSFAFLRER